MNQVTLKTVTAYLTIYFVWGSTYFFIKMALESFPPYPIVGLRFTMGGILLLALGFASSKSRLQFSLASVLSSMLLGTLLLLGANGPVTVAEQKVDSYKNPLTVDPDRQLCVGESRHSHVSWIPVWK